MKDTIAYLKKIQLWRYIVASVLLLGVPLETYGSFLFGHETMPLSFQETIIQISNSSYSYFILLLLIADFGFAEKQETGRSAPLWRSFGSLAVLCLGFTLFLVAASLLTFLIRSGAVPFSEKMTEMPIEGQEQISASLAMGAGLLLLFLSLMFASLLVSAVNSRCLKRPLGYICILVISLLDTIASKFELTSLGIFPDTYSSVDCALRLTGNAAQSITISVGYWLVLIAAAALVYHIASRQQKLERR